MKRDNGMRSRCKQVGLTVNETAEYSGQSRQTLGNWFKLAPEKFEGALHGAALKKMIRLIGGEK